jgi:hypothetical protein
MDRVNGPSVHSLPAPVRFAMQVREANSGLWREKPAFRPLDSASESDQRVAA